MRGEHNLYIQFQSPLRRHSNSRYRRDQTRPDHYFSTPEIGIVLFTRPSWAGPLKSNSFFATPIAACILSIALLQFFFSTKQSMGILIFNIRHFNTKYTGHWPRG